MWLKRNGLWLVFALFALVILATHTGEPIFFSHGPFGAGKLTFWLLFLGFLGYSIYCSSKENIFKTIKLIYPYHWARQIGLDLYLGLVISGFLIFLNEGSVYALLVWVVPLFLFANLATLLYIALNFDSIVSHFV